MEILTLGSKIKKRRKELKLTLKELAGDRVTPAQLSYVETDKCKPSLDLLEYIAERLGLEMDYLLESEKKQVSRYCEYNIKTSRVLIINEDYEEARDKAVEVSLISDKYGLASFTGEAEICLGIISRKQTFHREAQEHYLRALESFSKIDNWSKIAETFFYLAMLSYEKRHYSSSLAYLIQAERFMERNGNADIILRLKIYYYMMMVYNLLGDNKKSLHYAGLVSESLILIYDRKKFKEMLLSEARSLEEQNKLDRAMEFMDKSLNLLNIISVIEFVSEAETSLGSVYSANGMLGESLTHLNKAAVLKRVMDDPTLPLTLLEVARNHIIKKDFDKALEVISEALNTSIKFGRRQYEALAYDMLYRSYNEKGDFIKAEESIRRSLDILEEDNDYRELAGCYIKMGEFYRKINREREAVEFISRSISLFKMLCDSGGKSYGNSNPGRKN